MTREQALRRVNVAVRIQPQGRERHYKLGQLVEVEPRGMFAWVQPHGHKKPERFHLDHIRRWKPADAAAGVTDPDPVDEALSLASARVSVPPRWENVKAPSYANLATPEILEQLREDPAGRVDPGLDPHRETIPPGAPAPDAPQVPAPPAPATIPAPDVPEPVRAPETPQNATAAVRTERQRWVVYDRTTGTVFCGGGVFAGLDSVDAWSDYRTSYIARRVCTKMLPAQRHRQLVVDDYDRVLQYLLYPETAPPIIAEPVTAADVPPEPAGADALDTLLGDLECVRAEIAELKSREAAILDKLNAYKRRLDEILA